jgi:hypothetical protein
VYCRSNFFDAPPGRTIIIVLSQNVLLTFKISMTHKNVLTKSLTCNKFAGEICFAFLAFTEDLQIQIMHWGVKLPKELNQSHLLPPNFKLVASHVNELDFKLSDQYSSSPFQVRSRKMRLFTIVNPHDPASLVGQGRICR